MLTSLLVASLLSAAPAKPAAVPAAPAPAPAAAEPSRAERALRASFYLNSVPTLVELVGELKKDIFDTLELDAKTRAAIEKGLADHWTEKRIYANSAAALEKQLPPEALDQALVQMTPEVQAMVKAGIGEATPEQAKAWLAEAKKHPEAKEREALAARIAAHMPQPDAFQELVGQSAEVLADVTQVATGTDELRAEMKSGLLAGLAPAVEAMAQKDAMVMGTVIAYRLQSTSNIKRLADALDSDAGKKLQKAAPLSLIAGARQTRAELVAQLKKEIKPPPKASNKK